jgi:hypothetical protein
MVTLTDYISNMESSVLGLVANVESALNTPTLELRLTMSFVGIPIVDMSASLTRSIPSLKRTMEPFGDLMRTALRLGLGDNKE